MIERLVAIVICAVGLILFGVALWGSWPDALGLSAILAITGAVGVALSFAPRPRPASDAPPPLPLGARLTRLFIAPGAAFRNLRAHPRWVAAFLIIFLSGTIYDQAFTRRLTPEVVTSAAIDLALADKPISASELATIKEQQLAAARSPLGIATQLAGRAAGVFIVLSAMAGLFVLGGLITGGRINFRPALAAAFSAAVPPALINTGLSLIVLYLKAPEEVHPIRGQRGLVLDNLGVFFSPEAQPALYTAASFIGLLSLYGLWLMAEGLRHSGERMTPRAAWMIALTLWSANLGFNLLIAAFYPKAI